MTEPEKADRVEEPKAEENPSQVEGSTTEPETKRRRKRASGWDTPAPNAVPVIDTAALQADPTTAALLKDPAVMANPAILAILQQQQQQKQQLALLVQQQMKQNTLNSQALLAGGQSGTSSTATSSLVNQAMDPTQSQQSAAQALAAAMSAGQQIRVPGQVPAQMPGVTSATNPSPHRIYVGSLHYDLKEDDIRGVFSAFGTITNVIMSHEPSTGKSKGYCFIEYESGLSAQQALQSMNGFQLAGRPIKVNKPTYTNAPSAGMTMPAPAPTAATTAAMLAAAFGQQQQPAVQSFMPPTMSTMPPSTLPPVVTAPPPAPQPAAPVSSNRILVTNIPNGMTSDILKSVFAPFGDISECSLITGSTSGFIEYKESECASYAVEQMDGFELVGQRLSVQWASPAPSTTTAAATTETTAVAAAPSNVPANGDSKSSTWRCALLNNMVSVEETSDSELEGEIVEECSKFGNVVQVKIVVVGDDAVRIFVLYDVHGSAEKAVQSLNGRFFGGRVISGNLYDHDVFLAGNYSA